MSSDIADKARRLCDSGKHREAIELCAPHALKGDKDCSCLIGWIYLTGGGGISKDLGLACKWLEPVASQRYPPASYLLGAAYFQLKDYEKSIKCYESAGNSGYSAGFYQLSKMYQSGFGVEACVSRAKTYREKAAQDGHIFAQRELVLERFRYAKTFSEKVWAGIQLVRTIFYGVRVAVSQPYSEKTFD